MLPYLGVFAAHARRHLVKAAGTRYGIPSVRGRPDVVGALSLSGVDAVIPANRQPLDGSTSRQKPEPIFGASCSLRHDETLEFQHGHAAGVFRR